MKRIALFATMVMALQISTSWAVQFDVAKVSGSIQHSHRPDINDNGDVIWVGDDSDSPEYEIYLKLFKSPDIIKLTENTFYESSPHISNNIDNTAVWYGYQSGIGYNSYWSDNQYIPEELPDSIHTDPSYQSESNDINAQGAYCLAWI